MNISFFPLSFSNSSFPSNLEPKNMKSFEWRRKCKLMWFLFFVLRKLELTLAKSNPEVAISISGTLSLASRFSYMPPTLRETHIHLLCIKDVWRYQEPISLWKHHRRLMETDRSSWLCLLCFVVVDWCVLVGYVSWVPETGQSSAVSPCTDSIREGTQEEEWLQSIAEKGKHSFLCHHFVSSRFLRFVEIRENGLTIMNVGS